MFQVFLVWRYFTGESRAVKITSFLASLGIILGVACLIVSMSVVSGVEKFIQSSIIDLYGDILIHKPGDKIADVESLTDKIKNSSKEVTGITPYAMVQGVAVREGHVYGVVLQGLEATTMNDVLNLKPRLVSGELDFKSEGKVTNAVVGKEAVKQLKLKIGDVFTVIVPRPSRTKISNFSPAQQAYRLAGIMDFGKYDYNEKVLVTSAESVQHLAGIGKEFLGFYVKIRKSQDAKKVSDTIREAIGEDYRVRDWEMVNINFFTALKVERVVIFIVVLFIVIVASFNISSTLLVTVMRRYSDISVFRTLGADREFMKRLFTYQGLWIGLIGAILGTFLGLALCYLIRHYKFIDIPGDIYKFDQLPINIQFFDVTLIFLVTILICYLSSLIPAARGSRLSPIEGLRYE